MDAQAATPTQTIDPFAPFLNPPSRMLIKYNINEKTASDLCNAGFPMRIQTAAEVTKKTDQRIAQSEARGETYVTRIGAGGHLESDGQNKHAEVHKVELSMLIVDAESYGFEQVDAYVLKKEANAMGKVGDQKLAPSYFFIIDMRPGMRTGWPTAEALQAAQWLLQKPLKFCHIYMNAPDNNVTVNVGHLLEHMPHNLKALHLGLDGKFSLGKQTIRS